MKIEFKIDEEFTLRIYVDDELSVVQSLDPSTGKAFVSEEDAKNWYYKRGFYIVGGSDASSM